LERISFPLSAPSAECVITKELLKTTGQRGRFLRRSAKTETKEKISILFSGQFLFHSFTKKNGFVTATKLGTTNKTFVAATKHFAAGTKRFFF